MSHFQTAFGDLKKSEFYQQSAAAASGGTLGGSGGESRGGGGAASSLSAILVHPCQKGNPLLRFISTVPWQLQAGLVPDYVLGADTCALYLSLRYHQLNPDYLTGRLDALDRAAGGGGRGFRLRVLLVQVDVLEPHHLLKQLTSVSLRCRLTLMLAWSADEAGRILDTYKAYEHKPATLIQPPAVGGATGGRGSDGVMVQLSDALTSFRSLNCTDAAQLLSTFGSLAQLLTASQQQLAACPGIGASKAAALHRSLHAPLLVQRSSGSSDVGGAPLPAL